MLADLLTVIIVTISLSLSLNVVEISLYEMHRKPHEVIVDEWLSDCCQSSSYSLQTNVSNMSGLDEEYTDY